MNAQSTSSALKIYTGGFFLFALLFADSNYVASTGFLGGALIEINAVCRDSAVQWKLVFSLTIYFIVFLILEWHTRSNTPYLRFSNSNIWLILLVVLTLLQYTLDYASASQSIQIPVLITGIVFGKLITTRACWRGDGTDRKALFLLCLLVFGVTVSALWQPQRAIGFQYHGIPRWSGVWDNPNLYGLLMGVGAVLAAGLGLGRRRMGHGRWQATLCVLLCSFAAMLCGIGLFKSYSRGAWFAVLCGLGYLVVHLIRPPATFSPPDAKKESKRGERETISRISRLYNSRLSFAVILISVAVLTFWQFCFSEARPAQRLFSVANANDFSWRNRVTAWQGAARMMMDRPWFGFGWGQAEIEYAKKYCPLNDSAAIQMNDYCMIGISAGVPALFCFVAYVGLCFKVGRVTPCAPPPANERLLVCRSELGSTPAPGVAGCAARPATGAFDTQPGLAAAGSPPSPPLVNAPRLRERERVADRPGEGCGELFTRLGGEGRGEVALIQTASEPVSGYPLQVICRAGAIVLLVGFWFDGGLFKLPVATVFWMLMELSRIEYPGGDEVTRLTSKAGNRSAPPHIGSHTKWEVWLRRIAWMIAAMALTQTIVYVGTPFLSVGDRTLAIARNCLIRRNETQDFAFLSTNADWHGRKLKTLLTHVQLANYNRQLISWQLNDPIYRDFVLSPVITGQAGEDFAWRRPLWEEFYPRIRHESSPEDAAAIVVRHLRERVTIAELPHPAREVPAIWLQQLTDETGFEIIYVAALRSVGVPARLNAAGHAEFYVGGQWQPAPRPAISHW